MEVGELMPKMSPEQEAAYALDFGVARSDLPRNVQEACDRLPEQRMRDESADPPSVADVEAADGRLSWTRGRRWGTGAVSSCAACR